MTCTFDVTLKVKFKSLVTIRFAALLKARWYLKKKKEEEKNRKNSGVKLQ
jgi:hypothetical protein